METLDDWIKQLEIGHYLSCSSGTTGKPAMMTVTEGDIELLGAINAAASVGTGLTRGRP